jgi:predicted nucleic acid-binding protein
VFVDTNVLVYARDPSDPEKQRRAAEWLAALWDEGTGRVSAQVLSEFYVTMVRKLDPPADRDLVRDDVAALATWGAVTTDTDVIETAWSIEDRFGFSWWDSLIVAQALRAGCGTLLTEDLQHGQQVFGIRVVNPFEEGPGE